MKVHKLILNISVWIALLAILFIPGNVPTAGAHRTEYGFPLRFFTQYHYEVNENRWFLQGVSIQLLNYVINVAIIYGVILGLKHLNNKLKKNRTLK
ncbi:hypothetical protein [Paenibacillus antarcticus]|uniref:Uncharacterized protein n=1 Tax=Paenibacillus antarcticus TaxID=253703 RepID=A0A162MD02_9BACL|nr:hypothetical protein [Paenibacillus antarcticus]OAB42333.1 hypothetical protein PBAT_20250 [Paenibacillus antarcticus]